MLEELHVAGLGVIEEAWLSLHPGLNVLTGETGAGKTMVTEALGLALGARAGAGLVRPGAERLRVEARFSGIDPGDLGPEQAEFLEEGELILARTVGAEGRSGGRLGGGMAPASVLQAVGDRLVEIHGQNQAGRVASAAAQTAFLDRYAGQEHRGAVRRFREVHASLGAARAELRSLEEHGRERERERDLVAYQVREIEAAGVFAGEIAALVEEECRLGHAEQLLGLSASAEEGLIQEGGAADRLRASAEALRAAAALDPGAGDLAGRLASIAAEAVDAVEDLRRYRESVEVDPSRLAEVRDRVLALRGLERKYGEGEEGILQYLGRARERLASLQDDEGSRTELAGRVETLEAEERSLGAVVSRGRAEAAPRLSHALTAEVRHLGMPGARMDMQLHRLEVPSGDGWERVELRFSPGAGQALQPLAGAASGGELSRAMLACRSVLADLDDIATLVFDEVDAGIGGRAAGAVGRRLATLAHTRQVLVVTHLAQIAAHADRHFVVEKSGGVATVREVAGQAREAELARMLSGSTEEIPLAHARELLAGAGAIPSPAG